MEEVGILEAVRNASANEDSRWPARGASNRLEPFCWPVLRPTFKLLPDASVFTIGSCFARSIEDFLHTQGFNTPALRFFRDHPELSEGSDSSVLNRYTPPSIFQELNWVRTIMDRDDRVRMSDIEPFLLDAGRGLVYDLMRLPTHEFGRTPENALEQRRLLYELFKFAFTSDAVVITLGLIECWWDRDTENYVEYNRRFLKHTDRFCFRRLDYPVALDFVQRSIDLINRDKERPILLTTSPVPLNRTFMPDDVIVANTYSKSVLRAVAGAIQSKNPSVDYFPSFESVMLSRDTSVWMDDLIHVRSSFVGSIMLRVSEAYVGSANPNAAITEQMLDVVRLTAHRQWDTALARFRTIDLSKTPMTPLDFYVCGAELEAQAGNRQAVEDLVARPGRSLSGDLLLRAARALDTVGSTDKAALCREVALDGVRGNFQTLWNWFNLLRLEGRKDDLAWMLVAAEPLVEGDASALWQLAQLNEVCDRGDRARALYRKVLEIDPHNEIASLKLAYILFDKGRRAEGLELLETLSAAGSDSLYLHPLVSEHLRQGRSSEARALLDRLMVASPGHTGLLHLAKEFSVAS